MSEVKMWQVLEAAEMMSGVEAAAMIAACADRLVELEIAEPIPSMQTIGLTPRGGTPERAAILGNLDDVDVEGVVWSAKKRSKWADEDPMGDSVEGARV